MKHILFVLLVLCSSLAFAEERRFNIPLGDSPSQGPADAPVTIVEFLDFQ
jgi:hypothetical protein